MLLLQCGSYDCLAGWFEDWAGQRRSVNSLVLRISFASVVPMPFLVMGDVLGAASRTNTMKPTRHAGEYMGRILDEVSLCPFVLLVFIY